MGLFGPPNVEKMKARKDVMGLINALNYWKDSQVRIQSALALGEIGDLRALQPLVTALKDWDSDAHDAAAEALVEIGKPAIECLIVALKGEDEDVKSYSVKVLNMIGEPALEPLMNFLKDEDRDPFLWSVENGHTELVKLFLDKGEDVNTRNGEGMTLLHHAAQNGQMEAASLLLDRGADINAKDSLGNTPLMINAFDPGWQTMLLLIERGADVNAQRIEDDYTFTVLDFTYPLAFAYDAVILKRHILGTWPPGTVPDAVLARITSGKLNPKLEILLKYGAQGDARTMDILNNPLEYLKTNL